MVFNVTYLNFITIILNFNLLYFVGFVLFGNDTCGDTMFKNKTGVISGQDPGKGKTCSYYIIAGNYTPQVIVVLSCMCG